MADNKWSCSLVVTRGLTNHHRKNITFQNVDTGPRSWTEVVGHGGVMISVHAIGPRFSGSNPAEDDGF
jgi:hypothetical protein